MRKVIGSSRLTLRVNDAGEGDAIATVGVARSRKAATTAPAVADDANSTADNLEMSSAAADDGDGWIEMDSDIDDSDLVFNMGGVHNRVAALQQQAQRIARHDDSAERTFVD